MDDLVPKVRARIIAWFTVREVHMTYAELAMLGALASALVQRAWVLAGIIIAVFLYSCIKTGD